VLIEWFINKKSIQGAPMNVVQVACGSSHSLALMNNGELYSWGNNEHGQCGTGKEPFQQMVHWGPQFVRMDSYHNPQVKQVNAGAAHTALLDGN
jgi:alpha-tubulin suppressor-like RCC1 family protein